MNSHSQYHTGFALLYSILVAAVIFFVTAGVYSVSLRESVISASARDSQVAYYAADNGLECALYAEIVDDAFLLGDPDIDCNEDTFDIDSVVTPDGYEYEVLIQSDLGCAIVHVDTDHVLPTGNPGRRIRSKGFNLCDASGPLSDSPFLVQRVLRATYRHFD